MVSPMRWSTGGSFAILVCAAVVGCGAMPGRPTSQQVEAARSAESATPGDSSGGTTEDSAREPEQQPPASRTPGPRVPPRTTDLPGVPGSPVTYDVTIFYAFPPDEVRQKIEDQLAPQLPPHCRPDLCGITFRVEPQEGGDCVTSTAPLTVYPGGTITIFLGVECPETTSSESPEPTSESTSEPASESTPESASEPTSSGP